MKTLVLNACMLVVIYSANPILKIFHDNVAMCVQELNKPPTEPEVVYCTVHKQGSIDEKGRYMIEKGIARLDDLVADEVKRNNIKEVIRHCYAQNQYGSDIIINDEETRKIIKCSMPAFALIDKLQ
ncbi:uncharacterized protein [Cardiocondyla obscurior]|uniref:uncharacterized protein n=1 Tax=Cardiocondyla obscurior TaxID=286306 RepID=UPI0039656EB9